MYFLVKRAHGPSWDPSRPRREQDGWDAHAEFMDRLVEEGFVVLGDGVDTNDVLFSGTFPYVASPHQGYEVP